MSEKDLVHHHKLLKQFLDISDDSSRANKNSTRAARAREKLLKLSLAQFKELSTDVYDELKRRIDESRGEPDYLLPKSTFHPKRNQARQKLASLPQSRFKDLVSDISFEIERRGLHIERSDTIKSEPSYISKGATNSSHLESNKVGNQNSISSETFSNTNPITSIASETLSPDTKAGESKINGSKNENNVKGTEAKNPPEDHSSISIQSRTVVPTKANLTWSSDEEDEEDHHKINEKKQILSKAIPPQDNEAMSNKNLVEELREQVSKLQASKDEIERKYHSLQEDYDFSMKQNTTLSNELDVISQEKQGWVDKNSSNEKLAKELESLKSMNASLRLENQSLKSSPKQTNKEIVTPLLNHAKQISPSTSINTIAPSSKEVVSPAATSANNSSINEKMDMILQKMNSFDRPSSTSNNADPKLWQRKYEKLRSKQISTSFENPLLSKDLQPFVNSAGLISLKLVADVQSLVESFYIMLNSDKRDADALFDTISKISVIGNEIANQGDQQQLNSNGYSTSLREAINYALITTRYYAIYNSLLPKVIVERSIGELSFTLCDLISSSKLNANSSNSRSVTIESVKSPTSDDFGARPLKMANKLMDAQQETDINTPIHSTNAGDSEHNNRTIADKGIPPMKKTVIDLDNKSTQLDNIYKVSPLKSRDVKLSDSTTSKDQEQEQPTGFFSKLRNKLTIPIVPGESQDNKQPDKLTHQGEESGSKNQAFQPQALKTLEGSLPSSDKGLNIENSSKSRELDLKEDQNVDVGPLTPTRKETKDLFETPLSTRSINIQEASEKLTNKISPKSKNITSLASKFENSEEFKKNGSSNTTSPLSKGGVKSLASKWNENIENTPTNTSPQRTPPSNSSILNKVRKFEVDLVHGKEIKPDTLQKVNISKKESVPLAQAPEDSHKELSGPENKNHNLNASIGIVSGAAVGAIAASTLIAKKDDVPEQEPQQKPQQEPTVKTSSMQKEQMDDDFPLSRKLVSNSEADANANVEKQALASDDKSSEPVLKSDIADTENRHVKRIPSNNLLNHKPLHEIGNVQSSNKPLELNVQKSNLKSIDVPVTKSSMKVVPVSKSVKINSNVDEDYADDSEDQSSYEDYESEDNEEEEQARKRQEYRKSMAAATFNVDLFDIDDPDNTLTQVLLYLEHQTVEVISTIQTLLTAIKKPDATRGELREKSKAITVVILQMTEATNTSMNQTRNAQLKEHGNWVVKSLEDCDHRMVVLCKPNDKSDDEYADKSFKQRLAGISFDIAKCTKELVKTVEEASLKEDIEYLNNRISREEDLT